MSTEISSDKNSFQNQQQRRTALKGRILLTHDVCTLSRHMKCTANDVGKNYMAGS
jgi:hypothetical protein